MGYVWRECGVGVRGTDIRLSLALHLDRGTKERKKKNNNKYINQNIVASASVRMCVQSSRC